MGALIGNIGHCNRGNHRNRDRVVVARRALISGVAALAALPRLARADAFTGTAPGLSPSLNLADLRNAAAGRTNLQSSLLALRAPTPNDDTTKAYAIGDLWNGPTGLLQAQRVTAGQAVWLPYVDSNGTTTGTLARPLDIKAVAAGGAAYGTRLLNSGYAGKCLNIVRASDSTAQDIGFLSDGSLDTGALDGFLAGTTGRIATWYDQSGNTNHATQVTAALRMTISPVRKIGNSRSIISDGTRTIGLPSATSMNIPAAVAPVVNNYAVFSLVGALNITHIVPIFELNTGASKAALALGTNGNTGQLNYTPGGSNNLTGVPLCDTPNVVSVNVSGSAITLNHNGKIVATASNSQSYTTAGGTINGSNQDATFNSCLDYGCLIIYPTACTAQQQADINASINSLFGLTPQARSTIVFDGDSHTDGMVWDTLQQSYPRVTMALLQRPDIRMVNAALFGTTLASRVTAYPTNVAPAFITGGANNWVHILDGTNDIGGGATAAATYASLQSYCALARATGFKVAVGTLILRSNSAPNTAAIQAYNALIRAGWAGIADALIDYAADPWFGLTTGWSGPVFGSDATHLTDYGNAGVAQIAAGAFAALLQ